ncbi:MAG: response regulator, partial [Candidatus Cloacimonetes bacterium]|nr:response regulator [Candidatus Cloacimonadota bacterium]
QKAEPAHESQSILVVEDEKEVRELVNQVLLNAGYQTNMADSAEMALTILNDARQRFDLIVTDIVMPGMNGMELGKQVNILHPGMKILYMSAYTNESFSEEKIISRDEFLQKPFLPSVLTGRVHRLLDSGIQPPLS